MKSKYKVLIALVVILVLGLIVFFGVRYLRSRDKGNLIKRKMSYRKPSKEVVHKKITSKGPSQNSPISTIYMTTPDLDIIPSHFLEDLKTKYLGPIEIHGVQSCEDFLYDYYGPDTMQAYREMDRVSREIFWGYCILYIKGGFYCSIRDNIGEFPSLSDGDTKWYQSKDGSVTLSNKLNSALWDLIILSIDRVKATLGVTSLKSSVKPISISSVRSKELPSWAKDHRDVSEELHRLHEGMSPVNKDKIDLPILYINMDRSTDRRKFIEEQTRGLSKPVIRITGVLVTDEMLALYTRGNKRGAVGCFLAHRNAMKELLKKGWDKALILEDDGCLHMSSRWPKKLSELEAPSWLSQGTTAYIITPSIARDFLERTEGLTDLTRGVDDLLMIAYGNNVINGWSSYPLGSWTHYPYVYPAAHLFETEIQGFTRKGYLQDCARSNRIINSLGGGTKKILLSKSEGIRKEPGSHTTMTILSLPVSRSQLVKLMLRVEGSLEVYSPLLQGTNLGELKNVKIFDIPYTNLMKNSIIIRNYSKNHPLPKTSFHIVVVCTPNYDHIGQYGISMLSKYCQQHGYELSVVRDAIKDLHVNFTKNSAAISTLKSSKADYIVNIDADVVVKDFSVELADIIVDPNAVMQAPEDYWCGGESNIHSIINGGFIIWKNCTRAIEINDLWLSKARGECRDMARDQHPRQQNTFQHCVFPSLKEGDLAFLDHKLVGLPHSSVIAQTGDGEKEKKIRKFWIEAGSPPLKQGFSPLNTEVGWNALLAQKRLGKPNLLFSKLTDKLQAKRYTSLPTARVLWHTNKESDLRRMKSLSLPSKFAVKATHASGWNVLVRDGKPNWSDIEKKCKEWLRNKFGGGKKERHYQDITPGVLIEEYLDIAEELKCHVFNGKVVVIEHLRNGDLSKCAWYTNDWQKLDVRCQDPVYEGISPKPKNLRSIISTVESDVRRLGLGEYVRYDTLTVKNGDVLFGEFTFTPGALTTGFIPNSFELLLGSFLESGVNDMEKIERYRTQDVIVSLTTIPQRIDNILPTIESLLSQDFKPKNVCLFIDYNMSVPRDLQELSRNPIFVIIKVNHIGPATKYVYSHDIFPKAMVAVCDDDQIYPPGWLSHMLDVSKGFNYEKVVGFTGFVRKDRLGSRKDLQTEDWHSKDGNVTGYKIWNKGNSRSRLLLWPQGYTGYLLPPDVFSHSLMDVNNYCLTLLGNQAPRLSGFPRDLPYAQDDVVVGAYCDINNIEIIQATTSHETKPNATKNSDVTSIGQMSDKLRSQEGEGPSMTLYKLLLQKGYFHSNIN